MRTECSRFDLRPISVSISMITVQRWDQYMHEQQRAIWSELRTISVLQQVNHQLLFYYTFTRDSSTARRAKRRVNHCSSIFSNSSSSIFFFLKTFNPVHRKLCTIPANNIHCTVMICYAFAGNLMLLLSSTYRHS